MAEVTTQQERLFKIGQDENRLLYSLNRAIGDPILVRAGPVYLLSAREDFVKLYAVLVEKLRRDILKYAGTRVFVSEIMTEISGRGEYVALIAKCFKREI